MPFWQLQETAQLGAERCFRWDFITCFVSQGVSVGLPSSSPLLHPPFSFHQPCIDPTHSRETTGSTCHFLENSLVKTPTAEPCYKLCVEGTILVMCLMGWEGDDVHAGLLLLLHSSPEALTEKTQPLRSILGNHRVDEVWSGQPQRCWAQSLESMQCEGRAD